MENKVSFFEQFYVALMKHRKYKALLELSKKQHIVYFLGLTFLLTLIAFVIPMTSFLAGLGGYEKFFLERMPAFSIEAGKMTIAEDLDFKLNTIHVVMNDSVKEYTQADVENAEELVLFFSQTNMVTNITALPVEIKYEMFGNIKVDNQSMAGMSGQFYGSLVLSGLFSWISQMISYAGLALLFALCGMGINRVSGANLPFKKLFCIAIYAETLFAIASNLIVYFVSGGFVFVAYLISAMISLRALNTGILVHAVTPPEM